MPTMKPTGIDAFDSMALCPPLRGGAHHDSRRDKRAAIVPGVYDSLSAMLVREHEFQHAWISGFSVASSLGCPDNNSLGIKRFLERVKEIAEASDLQLLIDCDEGYGSEDNALFFVSELLDVCQPGLLSFEDNVFPKTNSFKSAERRLAHKTTLGRTFSAIKRRFPAVKLLARTEALICHRPVSEAYDRSLYYEECGADYILIHSRLTSFLEYRALSGGYPGEKPLVVIPSLAEDSRLSDLPTLPFELVLLANQLLRTGLKSMTLLLDRILSEDNYLGELHSGMASMDYLFALIDKKR